MRGAFLLISALTPACRFPYPTSPFPFFFSLNSIFPRCLFFSFLLNSPFNKGSFLDQLFTQDTNEALGDQGQCECVQVCMCMCVCRCAYVCPCMCLCTGARVHMCTRVHVCVCTSSLLLTPASRSQDCASASAVCAPHPQP